METARLYYTNAYRTRFSAQIIGHAQVDQRPALILDQTAFYPTSGGQPHDTGAINDLPVVDVIAQDRQILHVLGESATGDGPLAVGDTVQGVIDWPRRFDHMQQHTGQHLISQVFIELFNVETVAVHFGAEESTLDVAVADLAPDQLAQAETYANDIIYQALSVLAYEVLDRELDDVPLRRPPKVNGPIRIVEIERWDYSACGGTHCRSTAEVGIIKFLRQERRKDTTRLVFVCGRRAYRDYANRHAWLTEIAAQFSADAARTPELTAQLLAQNSQLQRRVTDLTAQLAAHEAAGLWQRGETLGPYTLVAQAFDERPVDWLKAIAAHLQTMPGALAVLAAPEAGKTTVIVARADDAPLHAGQLLRAALAHFGGGGGGRPEFAQGGGVAPAQIPALIDFAAAQVRAEISAHTAK